jgi:hypothetical protein
MREVSFFQKDPKHAPIRPIESKNGRPTQTEDKKLLKTFKLVFDRCFT